MHALICDKITKKTHEITALLATHRTWLTAVGIVGLCEAWPNLTRFPIVWIAPKRPQRATFGLRLYQPQAYCLFFRIAASHISRSSPIGVRYSVCSAVVCWFMDGLCVERWQCNRDWKLSCVRVFVWRETASETLIRTSELTSRLESTTHQSHNQPTA